MILHWHSLTAIREAPRRAPRGIWKNNTSGLWSIMIQHWHSMTALYVWKSLLALSYSLQKFPLFSHCVFRLIMLPYWIVSPEFLTHYPWLFDSLDYFSIYRKKHIHSNKNYNSVIPGTIQHRIRTWKIMLMCIEKLY